MWCDGCVRAERRAFAMNPTCPGLSHIQHSSYDLDETGKKGRKVGGSHRYRELKLHKE